MGTLAGQFGSDPFLFAAGILFAYMVLCYLIALYLANNSIVDTAWGLGFVLVSAATLERFGVSLLGSIVVTLIGIWGLRLSSHVYARNRTKGEDFRYAKWRAEWTWVKTRSFFQVFMLQGVILYLIVLPALFASSQPAPAFSVISVFGVLVWILGFTFESIGDAQLAQFIRNPDNKGKLIESGLWRYTRHPNYFGEATMWWGIWLIAVPAIVPFGWLAILGTFIASPIGITYMLLKVSGVPLLEEAMQKREGWAEYAAKTSVFIPLPPRT